MIVLKQDIKSKFNLDAYCYDTSYTAIYLHKEFEYGKNSKEAIDNLIVALCKKYKVVYINRFK